jgi:hypothetical protein
MIWQYLKGNFSLIGHKIFHMVKIKSRKFENKMYPIGEARFQYIWILDFELN